jgi:hypothetical protein
MLQCDTGMVLLCRITFYKDSIYDKEKYEIKYQREAWFEKCYINMTGDGSVTRYISSELNAC